MATGRDLREGEGRLEILNRNKRIFLLTGPNSANLFHSRRVGRDDGNLYRAVEKAGATVDFLLTV